MFKKPTFQPHLRVEIVEPDKVYLISEKKHFVLVGRTCKLISYLLLKNYTIERIIQELDKELPIEEIFKVLIFLKNKGYITEFSDELSSSELAFWSIQGFDSLEALEKIKRSTVSLTSAGDVPIAELKAKLKALKVNILGHEDRANLAIVLTNDYLEKNLTYLNKKFVELNQPWMLCKPIGASIWLGPIFLPGITGCWNCLSHRLKENREVEYSVKQQKGGNSSFCNSISMLSSTWEMGLNLCATEVVKWLVSSKSSKLTHSLFTFDTTLLDLQHHTLPKRPQCPVCGNSELQRKQFPKAFELNECRKRFFEDGGHRIEPPEKTLEKLKHLISPITGVVSNLKCLSAQDKNVYVYSAVHNFSTETETLVGLRRALSCKSTGKGKTDAQARVSAIGEAIERYSGIYTGEEFEIPSAYIDISKDAIHPNACMLYSSSQYYNRITWNQEYPEHWIAEPFDETKEILWSPAWSLTNKRFKYIPSAFCYYGHSLPKNHQFCKADSNGCAAGSTYEEAILQGFMELIERDSISIWWYNRITRPALNLSGFNEPYLDEMQHFYDMHHRDLWVLDITTDLKIPTFAAVSTRKDKDPRSALFGFGSHFDARIAVLRAVTELNQPFSVLGETGYTTSSQLNRRLINHEDMQYIFPDDQAAVRTYSDYSNACNNDLRKDIETCVEAASRGNLEVLIVDQTRPDTVLKVTKVIVPGLRPIWARYAPGRLYEVPITQKWMDSPLIEQDLNPIPIFTKNYFETLSR
jgi:oxazoline/thiazoline synthase